MAICHHKYVGGIHLNQFEYRKEKNLHPLDMKSLVCLSFSLALFSTKKCSGWRKPCGLLHLLFSHLHCISEPPPTPIKCNQMVCMLYLGMKYIAL